MIPRPIAYLAQESNSASQARRALEAGFKAVALRLGTVTAEGVKAFRDTGLFVAVWGPAGASTVLPAGAQAFIPQIESDAEYNGAIAAIKAGVGKGLPIGVVSHYWGLYNRLSDGSASRDGQRVATLRSLGVTEYHVETYGGQDGHWNVDGHLLWGQYVVGMYKSEQMPLLGTWMGETPDEYAGLDAYVPNYGIYIIEQTSDTQLVQYKALAAPAPVVPDPAPINAEINELAHTWLDPHEGDDALSRLRSIARITKTTDSQWVNARARIIAALDSVGASEG